jgi:signal transduction histidine kinase
VLSLRNFSRHDEADVKTVDIHEGLESTLLILKQKLKDIEIVKDYGPLPHVRCYPSQLNQVFMNILANAADALSQEENRGAIVWMRSESPTIKIHTFVPQPGQVTIQITDNGPGIPPEIKSQMFDPFFTTKPVGQGTGLGLSISHQIIVEQHGGAITCESEWERGTTFNITIPMKVF